MMDELRVSGTYKGMSGKDEGTCFEIVESGPVWIFYYDSPTEEEINDVSAGSSFEIRSLIMDGVLWVLAKCGTQEWAEAPYNPHLSRAPELQPVSGHADGYALTILLIDRLTDTIKSIRVIGLGNRFSRQLYSDINELKAAPFSPSGYQAAISKAQARYTTAQLVRLTNNYWRI